MPQQENRYSRYGAPSDEIMGRMPGWMIRWGITLIAAIFLGILVGCYFIKYPQTLQAPIVITMLNPPADLVSRYDGKIENIFAKEGQKVKQGEIIAVLENVASYSDVMNVEQYLQECFDERNLSESIKGEWIDKQYNMGDIQTIYSEFAKQCLSYRHYIVVPEKWDNCLIHSSLCA